MANICRVLEQAAPPPLASPTEPGGRRSERNAPRTIVRIGGKNLDQELLSSRIQSVVVAETSRGLSSAEITILNQDLRFTDMELLRGESLSVEIFTGYAGLPLVKRGSFRAVVPKFAFRNTAMPTIKLQCFGQEWPLMAGERRRVWENLKDSEIASKIAREYGLLSDVEDTGLVYEHVAEFNVTDMEFLENRALLYGYDVYVEEGVLHFHSPKFEHSNLNLIYGKGETGIIQSFDVIVDPWVYGASWTKSGIDRLTGKEWSFSSEDSSNSVANKIKAVGGLGFRTASKLAEVDGIRPDRFVIGEGHELTEGEARKQVAGITRATEWVCQGSGVVKGIELLKARQVVTLGGLGHLAGDYYVTKVRHAISGSSSYKMSFEVIRPGTGRLIDDSFKARRSPDTDFDRRNVTNESTQAGTARVS